jgi:hypothetical protein
MTSAAGRTGTSPDLGRTAFLRVLIERRTSRSGKDSIDHGPAGHDDVVNAAAGALVTAKNGCVWQVLDWDVDEVATRRSYDTSITSSLNERPPIS